MNIRIVCTHTSISVFRIHILQNRLEVHSPLQAPEQMYSPVPYCSYGGGII